MKTDAKLGDVDIVKITDNKKTNILYIANMYSQFRYGNDGKRYTDYDYLRICLKELSLHIVNSNKSQDKINFTLAIPHKLGCGVGGGNWNIVSQIIVEELKDIEYTIYKLI